MIYLIQDSRYVGRDLNQRLTEYKAALPTTRTLHLLDRIFPQPWFGDAVDMVQHTEVLFVSTAAVYSSSNVTKLPVTATWKRINSCNVTCRPLPVIFNMSTVNSVHAEILFERTFRCQVKLIFIGHIVIHER